MEKTKIVYERWNPNSDYVSHVAIQTEANPPYVWRCYGKGETLPTLGTDMAILPIKAARNLFDFQEGKLEQVASQ